MITSFQELERHVLSHGLRGRIALANAQDEPALAALVRAQRAGAAEGTLIGPADEIARLLRGMGEQVSDYENRFGRSASGIGVPVLNTVTFTLSSCFWTLISTIFSPSR